MGSGRLMRDWARGLDLGPARAPGAVARARGGGSHACPRRAPYWCSWSTAMAVVRPRAPGFCRVPSRWVLSVLRVCVRPASGASPGRRAPLLVSLRVMTPLNNASARNSMKRGSIGAGNHPASGGPTSSGSARARIGAGNHLLGQANPHWGRLVTCPNARWPAPMHCKVPQCAVHRLREEAEEMRLLPQPAPMRGSRPLRFPQGCHCAAQTAFAPRSASFSISIACRGATARLRPPPHHLDPQED